MGVTQKSDIYQILASRKDGEEMSVNMGIAASDFVSATSLFESGSIDMAMEITARAMRALGAAISSAPDVMLQVDRGGIFEMDAGKFYLAWKYSLKVMREIEDSLAECFPGNPPREDRPDNDSGLSQLLSENCTTKAVPNGRGGSGTELITQCEQVIIDSNKWTGLSIGRP